VGRWFTCIFALSGIAFGGVALGILGQQWMEAQEKAWQASLPREFAQKQVLTLLEQVEKDDDIVINNDVERSTTNDNSLAHETTCDNGLADTDILDSVERSTQNSSHRGTSPVHRSLPIIQQSSMRQSISSYITPWLAQVLGMGLVLTVFAMIVAWDPGIHGNHTQDTTWGDALYFAIVTATTVGYGDMSPQTQSGRLMALVLIPLAVGSMGHCLSRIANTVVDTRQQRAMRHKMATQELTLHDIIAMDEDGDGQVTMSEFMEFMLIAMGKVDKELWTTLEEHFHRLDADCTGALSRRDLIAAARRKLQSPQRKLELAAYKEDLLRRARQATLMSTSSLSS
jgi:Ion channel